MMSQYNTKRLVVVAIKVLIFLAVVVWVIWELNKSWSKISEIEWQANYYWLVLSAVFYFLAYIPTSLFWRYSMISLGQRPGIYESIRAYYIGHLGKYVPGKAVVVILRSGLLDHSRTSASVAAAAVFLETLTMMSSGAILSALIVLVWFRGMENGVWLMLLAVGMAVGAGLPIIPPVFRMLTKRLVGLAKKFGVSQKEVDVEQKMLGLSFRTLAVGFGLTAVTWIFLGLSLWGAINGIGIETEPLFSSGGAPLARFTLAASFSVVLGFVLMMPGGIGVRDFVLAMVLTMYFEEYFLAKEMSNLDASTLATSYAIVVAGIQRAVSILVELFVAAAMFKKP
ncbi:MAG: flippase-like domain-containing protein [Planctomycetaceae bacterium]|jgi:uncharacterized membrane protein YbhN (UPF0104 family)|nr:flippase-like domain-containing protein [Planctomycetaceae bacterium]